MTGNPNFTNPNPSLADFSSKIIEVESVKVQTDTPKKNIIHTVCAGEFMIRKKNPNCLATAQKKIAIEGLEPGGVE